MADFLAVKNLLEATVERRWRGGRATLAHRRGGLSLQAADDGGYRPGATVSVGIRPERTQAPRAPAGRTALAGILDDEIYLGDSTEWHVRARTSSG